MSDFLSRVDLTFNVWGSFPFNGGHEDAEELDYSLTLSRDLIENLNLSFGYVYFDYPNTASTADVQESWLSLSLSKLPILPIEVSANIFAGYDFATKSGGPDEGWYYSWGLATDLVLPKCTLIQKEQALSLSVTNWGNDGVAGLEPNFLYATELGLSATYDLFGVSVMPSFNYAINYEDSINNGDDEVYCGVALTYAF